MSNELAVQEIGQWFVKSRYFQDASSVEQAIVKVLAGRELGFGPVAAMTGIYIVKGRVTLSANLLAAQIKRHPNYDYHVMEHTAESCEIAFYQDGQELGRSEFTIADAEAAELSGNNWKKYPRNMLFARAISNGVKWHCPDVMSGMPVYVYTPDEIGASVDGETGEVITGSYQVVEKSEEMKAPPDLAGYLERYAKLWAEAQELEIEADELPNDPTVEQVKVAGRALRMLVDAKKVEVEKDEPEKHTWPAQIVAAFITENLAQDSYQAVGRLNKSRILTPEHGEELAVEWGARYRCGRDGGKEPAEAADAADGWLADHLASA